MREHEFYPAAWRSASSFGGSPFSARMRSTSRSTASRMPAFSVTVRYSSRNAQTLIDQRRDRQTQMHLPRPMLQLRPGPAGRGGDRHQHRRQGRREGQPLQFAGPLVPRVVRQVVGERHLLDPPAGAQEIRKNQAVGQQRADGREQADEEM